MIHSRMCRCVVGIALLIGSIAALAQTESHSRVIYAKQLVLETVKEHPDMLDLIFHVTPPQKKDNYAIAAYTAKEEGQKSGDDDLGVMKTGKPLVEVQKDGVRVGVLVPLKDQHGKVIGALGLMYVYHAGESTQAFLARSNEIRDELAKRIPSRAALFKEGKP